MRWRHGCIARAGDEGTPSEPPGWYHAALVEYEAHRAEVIAEAAAQQQTLTIGGTAAGIVFAGGLNVWHDQLLAAAALMGGVPLICLLVVVQWSARTIGLMRVGAYLERIELILRTHLEPPPPDPLFTWERTLVERQPSSWWTPHAGWNDGGGAAVFIPLAFAAIALGAYRGYGGHALLVGIIVAAEGLVAFALSVYFLYFGSRARANARSEFRLDQPTATTTVPDSAR
jgi:hypothetical protein